MTATIFVAVVIDRHFIHRRAARSHHRALTKIRDTHRIQFACIPLPKSVCCLSKIRAQRPLSSRTNLVCYTDSMNDADIKKLDQIIVMLADMIATFGDRFDKIDGRLAKHDQR